MITFYFSIFEDLVYAERLAKQLFHLYPSCQVVAITDGPQHEPSLAKVKDANPSLLLAVTDERLKVSGKGGAFTQRNLEILLSLAEESVSHFIKLDPDSYMWRRFINLMDCAWFGGVFTEPITQAKCCAGGCWGMKASVAEDLCTSGLLLDSKFNSSTFEYYRYGVPARAKVGDNQSLERQSVPREDAIVGVCMNELGYYPEVWQEVYLRQNGEFIQTLPYLHAVTHPVRTIP